MDCAMDYNMRTTLDATSDATSFMHQMIPHHNNAINMAKLLMKKDTTLAADDAITDILWSIINNQGMQVQFMEGWLEGESKPASAVCTSRRKLTTPNLRVAAEVEAATPRKLTVQGTGSGTDADPCVTTNCASTTECTYTATVDPHAGPTGYFKFAECGDVANPVIVMKRGVTYTFDQSDNSNWYHPLGFAYFVDGAHNEVDELEPGINPPDGGACYLGSGNIQCNKNKEECTALGSEYWYEPGYLSSHSGCCLCQASCDHTKETVADPSTCSYYDSPTCAAENTCQAPMYYKDGVFAGAGTYPTADNDGDFGLDAYEPEFFIRKEDWLVTKYSVALTLTDTTYATDIFYFCHIHAGMSGYIKIADSTGTVVSTTGTDNALIASDYHKTPSTYDLSCGTYGLDEYKVGGAKECASEDFFCGGVGSLASGSFGDCLHAMDCAMDYNMRTTLDATSDATSFMHQMIPHHNN